jgi:hydroxymethylpyrimidine pyrophosphatase-like HAD family hydrolase
MCKFNKKNIAGFDIYPAKQVRSALVSDGVLPVKRDDFSEPILIKGIISDFNGCIDDIDKQNSDVQNKILEILGYLLSNNIKVGLITGDDAAYVRARTERILKDKFDDLTIYGKRGSLKFVNGKESGIELSEEEKRHFSVLKASLKSFIAKYNLTYREKYNYLIIEDNEYKALQKLSNKIERLDLFIREMLAKTIDPDQYELFIQPPKVKPTNVIPARIVIGLTLKKYAFRKICEDWEVTPDQIIGIGNEVWRYGKDVFVEDAALPVIIRNVFQYEKKIPPVSFVDKNPYISNNTSIDGTLEFLKKILLYELV